MAAPVGLLHFWRYRQTLQLLPTDAIVHTCVAWAVGALMAYLNDWYRRQMFANQKLAACAHDKELLEARARIKAQRALAAAQVRADPRAAGAWGSARGGRALGAAHVALHAAGASLLALGQRLPSAHASSRPGRPSERRRTALQACSMQRRSGPLAPAPSARRLRRRSARCP
jgi:hypothetical protein